MEQKLKAVSTLLQSALQSCDFWPPFDYYLLALGNRWCSALSALLSYTLFDILSTQIELW